MRLRPKDLAHAPVLRGLGEHGFTAPLDTIFPTVTCSVPAKFLTGLLPREHGAVDNACRCCPMVAPAIA